MKPPGGAKRRSRTPLVLLIPGLSVIALLLAALAVTGVSSVLDSAGNWSLQQYRKLFSDWFYLEYLWRSFRVAAYCTPITLLLGYPFAYVMARSSPPVRLVLTLVLIVQFFTSYIVRTYALVLVLGNNGMINRTLLNMGLLERPVPLLFNEVGVAIGLILIPLPFMVFPIYSVLKNIEPNLETAAASLGANRFKVFWLVTFPLSLPGVIAGIVLVFLFDLTAYVVPGMLGGGYFDLAANFIQEQVAALNYSFAAAISVVLLIASLLCLYFIHTFGNRLSRAEA